MRYRLTVLVLAGALALGSVGCDRGIAEGDLVVDNRTDSALTIYLLADEAPAEDAGLDTVPAGRTMTIPGADGCSTAGMEARDPDGSVVAELPPMDRDEHECRFTWEISEGDSSIDR